MQVQVSKPHYLPKAYFHPIPSLLGKRAVASEEEVLIIEEEEEEEEEGFVNDELFEERMSKIEECLKEICGSVEECKVPPGENPCEKCYEVCKDHAELCKEVCEEMIEQQFGELDKEEWEGE